MGEREPMGASLPADASPPRAPRPGRRLQGVPFVWAIWAVAFLMALAVVVRGGSRFPYYDDWSLVPVLTGNQALTPWLWAQHNEHRIPLPKLALYAVDRLSGWDFRAGMFLNVVLMAALSAAMLFAIRRLRGRLQSTDAFFPLLLLSLAQWESFLIGFALNLIASTVLAGAFLMLLTGGQGGASSRRAAAGMAPCLVLMPLVGGSGLALLPALALWLAPVAVLHCCAADAASRRWGRLTLALVAAALLLGGLYFVGYESVPGRSPTFGLTPKFCLELLSMVFGHAFLRWGGFDLLVVPALLLAAAGLGFAAWRRRPGDGITLLGFLAFALGMGCLVAAVTWGRSGLGLECGLAPRYATLMAPLGCCLYLLCERGRRCPRRPRMCQAVLFLLTGMAFLPNCKEGLVSAKARGALVSSFAADLASGAPPGVLADRDGGRMFPAQFKDLLAQWLCMLRDAGVRDFRLLPHDPPLCSWIDFETAAGVTLAAMNDVAQRLLPLVAVPAVLTPVGMFIADRFAPAAPPRR